jgi:hypothetical protein
MAIVIRPSSEEKYCDLMRRASSGWVRLLLNHQSAIEVFGKP